jgi:hypothetical protein
MIAKGIRLTGLRREILAALTPGQGAAADELRRRVATGRGLEPTSEGWPVFSVSYARALRLLEGRGVLELERAAVVFGKPCPTWVRLTLEGERERLRALGRDVVEGLASEIAAEDRELARWERFLEHAQDEQLSRLDAILARELARRNKQRALFA